MNDDLDLTDLKCLAWVAEGMASRVPDPVAARLLRKGLVQRSESLDKETATLQLTPAGLTHVRSSDQ